MDVLRDLAGSSVPAATSPVPAGDLPVDNVLDRDREFRGGMTIFGDRTPSADCHAIVNGLPLYTDPSDTACVINSLNTINFFI